MTRPEDRPGERPDDLVRARDGVEGEEAGRRGTDAGQSPLPAELPSDQPRPSHPDADPTGGTGRPAGDPADGEPPPQRALEDDPGVGASGRADAGVGDRGSDGVPAPNPAPATGDPEPEDADGPVTPGETAAGAPQRSPGAPTPQPPAEG